MFIDHVKINVSAGNGGSGCLSFRREKYVPKGGPDGGDGGKGGDIILQSATSLSTLLDFRYHPIFRAQRAEHGKGSNKHGKKGKNLIIKIPLGTIVKDAETGEILCDLVEENQSVIVAHGGRGGRGNARFVSSTNRAPRTWEQGEFGEERTLELELKLIADVGLVGLPNAGKSTLISRVSAARPKIADYPFTTIRPNLGIVNYRDIGSFVVADIPGIIEGAHQGKGLGHEFLRHIERTVLLIILVDINSDDVSHDFELLLNELQKYNEELPARVGAVLLTKCDLVSSPTFQTTEIFKNIPTFKISSVTGQGLPELKNFIWKYLQTHKN